MSHCLPRALIAHHGTSTQPLTPRSSQTQRHYPSPFAELPPSALPWSRRSHVATGWPPPSMSPPPPATQQPLSEGRWGAHPSKDLVQGFGALLAPTWSFSSLYHQLDEGPLHSEEGLHQDVAANASHQAYGEWQRVEAPHGGLKQSRWKNWLFVSPVQQAQHQPCCTRCVPRGHSLHMSPVCLSHSIWDIQNIYALW